MIRSGIWTTFNQGGLKESNVSQEIEYIYSGTSTTWTPPANIYSITFETWAGGGKGGGPITGTPTRTSFPGAGGGAYSRATIYPSSIETYRLTVGQGSTNGNFDGGYSTVSGLTSATVFCSAMGGLSVTPGDSGSGVNGGISTFGIGDVRRTGGSGGNSPVNDTGGGGGAAGSDNEGNSGSSSLSGGAGGAAASEFGGAGGNGGSASSASSSNSGQAGSLYGGGGGGAYYGDSGNPTGGNGANGLIRIKYTLII
jgi:hypothetical protein